MPGYLLYSPKKLLNSNPAIYSNTYSIFFQLTNRDFKVIKKSANTFWVIELNLYLLKKNSLWLRFEPMLIGPCIKVWLFQRCPLVWGQPNQNGVQRFAPRTKWAEPSSRLLNYRTSLTPKNIKNGSLELLWA